MSVYTYSFPGTIVVIDKPYQIIEVPTINPDDDRWGEIDSTVNTIKLRTGMHWSRALDTLAHELVHALDHNMKIGLSERQVTALGSGLFSLLTRNPDLVSAFAEAGA